MNHTRTESGWRRAVQDANSWESLSSVERHEGRRVRLRQLIRNDKGLAAIEFALVVPFLVLLYLGSVQLLQEIIVNRQVTLTATTVASIVSQYTTISASSQMPDILQASAQIMAPYPAANATVVVTAIAMDSSGTATVSWSQALNGTAQAMGTDVIVPPALAMPNTTLVLSEVTYTYDPTFNFLNAGPTSLHTAIYMVPRASATIRLAP